MDLTLGGVAFVNGSITYSQTKIEIISLLPGFFLNLKNNCNACPARLTHCDRDQISTKGFHKLQSTTQIQDIVVLLLLCVTGGCVDQL